MSDRQSDMDRRNFLKTAAAAGFSSVVASAAAVGGSEQQNTQTKPQEPKLPQVPRRKLGKTGVEVSCLCLGGDFGFLDKKTEDEA